MRLVLIMLFKLILLIFVFQYEATFFDSNADFKQILGTYRRAGLTLKNEEDSLIKHIIEKEKFVNSHFKREITDSNFRKILPSILPSESKTKTENNFKSEEKHHFFNNPTQPTNKLGGNKYWNKENGNQKRRTKRDLNEKIHRKADCFWFRRTPLTTAATTTTTTTTTTEGSEQPEAESLETSQRLSSRRRTRNRNRQT